MNTVGSRVLNNYKFLKSLHSCKSEDERINLIKHASFEELLSLVEICTNILQPCCFKLSTQQRKRLVPFADFIRTLARKRSERTAKRLLRKVQSGKGAGVLFAALLGPILTEASRLLLERLS